MCTDNCSVIGDAAIQLTGHDEGATSTHSGSVHVGGRRADSGENLVEQGITPDVYYNGHLAYER